MLQHTPFYDFHVEAGAKMVDFGGWEMPIMYRSINDEHLHTRASGSIFDVSHMGRLQISGKDAEAFLNYVFTRDVTAQKVGQCRYGLLCNERGGILDERALLESLHNGRLSGAALDVIQNEYVADDPLRQELIQYAATHSNLLITPHIGGASHDALARVEVFMARKLALFLQNFEQV